MGPLAPLTLATETTYACVGYATDGTHKESSSIAFEGAESMEVNVSDDIFWLKIPNNAIENADFIRVH